MTKILPFKQKPSTDSHVKKVDSYHEQQVKDYKVDSQLFEFLAISLGLTTLAFGTVIILAFYS